MELFCPPTNISPTVTDKYGIHICKSKAYNGEKYLMPRIGAAKVKSILKEEFGVVSELFEQEYKGRGVCLRYYPIEESFLIRIEAGTIFKIEGDINTPIMDTNVLERICAFHGAKSTDELKDVKQMRFFKLSDSKSFDHPKRTKNKNNSYSTDFYFSEIDNDFLPTGEEKER